VNQRLTKRSRLVMIVLACVLVAVITALVWYIRTDPLMDDGLTTYTDPVDQHKVYTVELVNLSRFDIHIQSVTVNNGMKPDFAQLGVTYDSGHLVQYMGDQTDPNTKFMDFHEFSIQPRLTEQELRNIFANKENAKKPTPIYYGVAIRYDSAPVKEVTVKYSYLGLTKTKEITRWFE